MNISKYVLLIGGFGAFWFAGATNLFVLNKTGSPLRYELKYNYNVLATPQFKVATRNVAVDMFGVVKTNEDLKAGWLREFSIVNDAGKILPIISFEGDKRIFNFCKKINLKGYRDDLLAKQFKAKITVDGSLFIGQNMLLSQEARPLVIAVTKNSRGYIITELKHTMRLLNRGPSSKVYAIQAMSYAKPIMQVLED
ncbi:hypothetical protein KAH94_01530 [bacterium]|nr:hypothetical protein [bacterium]